MQTSETQPKIERLKEVARFNQIPDSHDGLLLVRLSSFGDLIALSGEMDNRYSDLLNDPVQRQRIAYDISVGIEFALWYDENDKLCFER